MSTAFTRVARAPSSRPRLWTARGLGLTANLAAGTVALFVLLAFLGPWLAPHDPNAVSFGSVNAGPSVAHPFGFDRAGRDLLSRGLVGARSSLLGPLAVTALATVLGAAVALAAAWFRGWLDTVVSVVLDILFAIPGLLLAVLAVAVFGRGSTAPVLALALAYVPYSARLFRAVAITETSSPYIASLRVQGLSNWSIMRHVLANIRPTIIAQSLVSLSFATVELAALSYLGLGVQPPHADWGLMVAQGQVGVLQGSYGEALLAGLALVVAVLAINVLGTRLLDRAEVRGS